MTSAEAHNLGMTTSDAGASAPAPGDTGPRSDEVLAEGRDLTPNQRRQTARLLTDPRYATGSPFPPIADYAFLSDCHVNALVAPSGNVEWLCLPRPDGPSVFAAMLDRAAGSFRFAPS